MIESATSWLFRLQLEHTPSPSDPKGSDEFYQNLGTLVVAFGRLENHYLACIMAILATAATKELSKKLPMSWEERGEIWRDAFANSAALKTHQAAAMEFFADFKETTKDRNKLIHGLWERFIPGSPVTAGLTVIRRKKGTRDGVYRWHGTVSTEQIKQVAREADQLNIKLQNLSAILIAERGQPPLDVRIQ
jgi:hypothetical protein